VSPNYLHVLFLSRPAGRTWDALVFIHFSLWWGLHLNVDMTFHSVHPWSSSCCLSLYQLGYPLWAWFALGVCCCASLIPPLRQRCKRQLVLVSPLTSLLDFLSVTRWTVMTWTPVHRRGPSGPRPRFGALLWTPQIYSGSSSKVLPVFDLYRRGGKELLVGPG